MVFASLFYLCKIGGLNVKYTVVFQGDPDHPNQKITDPMDFEDACSTAAGLQADYFMDFEDACSIALGLQADYFMDNSLYRLSVYQKTVDYVVVPEFEGLSNG